MVNILRGLIRVKRELTDKKMRVQKFGSIPVLN